MKIEKEEVTKIKISDIEGLDPITVYLEDYEKGKGRITISCYDKSWNSYWGAMGNRTISEFFVSCDNAYIAKNISPISSKVTDYEKIQVQIPKPTSYRL